MKSFFIALVLLSNTAMAARTPVVLKVYRYTSSMQELTENLETQLAAQIAKSCGPGTAAKTESLSIVFENGPLAGGAQIPLVTTVFEVDGISKIDFPSHPQAVLTASFECL